MPALPKHCLVVRVDGGQVRALVHDPAARESTRWVLTDPSVLFVACPQCCEPVGAPCHGDLVYVAVTHTARRMVYQALKRRDPVVFEQLIERASVAVKLSRKLLADYRVDGQGGDDGEEE